MRFFLGALLSVCLLGYPHEAMAQAIDSWPKASCALIPDPANPGQITTIVHVSNQFSTVENCECKVVPAEEMLDVKKVIITYKHNLGNNSPDILRPENFLSLFKEIYEARFEELPPNSLPPALENIPIKQCYGRENQKVDVFDYNNTVENDAAKKLVLDDGVLLVKIEVKKLADSNKDNDNRFIFTLSHYRKNINPLESTFVTYILKRSALEDDFRKKVLIEIRSWMQ